MKDIIFTHPNKKSKELSNPLDYFKRLPKDTLNKLSNLEKKELEVKDDED